MFSDKISKLSDYALWSAVENITSHEIIMFVITTAVWFSMASNSQSVPQQQQSFVAESAVQTAEPMMDKHEQIPYWVDSFGLV